MKAMVWKVMALWSIPLVAWGSNPTGAPATVTDTRTLELAPSTNFTFTPCLGRSAKFDDRSIEFDKFGMQSISLVQGQSDDEPFSPGIGIGEVFPEITLADQTGVVRSWDSIKGKDNEYVAFVFFRSADW